MNSNAGIIQESPAIGSERDSSTANVNTIEKTSTRLLIENCKLKRLVELQRKVALNQRRTILDLRREVNSFKKKLSIRNSYKTSSRKTKLDVRK